MPSLQDKKVLLGIVIQPLIGQNAVRSIKGGPSVHKNAQRLLVGIRVLRSISEGGFHVVTGETAYKDAVMLWVTESLLKISLGLTSNADKALTRVNGRGTARN